MAGKQRNKLPLVNQLDCEVDSSWNSDPWRSNNSRDIWRWNLPIFTYTLSLIAPPRGKMSKQYESIWMPLMVGYQYKVPKAHVWYIKSVSNTSPLYYGKLKGFSFRNPSVIWALTIWANKCHSCVHFRRFFGTRSLGFGHTSERLRWQVY